MSATAAPVRLMNTEVYLAAIKRDENGMLYEFFVGKEAAIVRVTDDDSGELVEYRKFTTIKPALIAWDEIPGHTHHV